jgi:formylglycine-generating enzyme required for sulfatase activity
MSGGVLCFRIQEGLDMIIKVADILKELSRLKRATLPLTVLFFGLSILLSTHAIYAASNDPALSMKIGPLLRKTMEESRKILVDQQTATRITQANQASVQLHKVIVVINRDHLQPLPPEIIEELRKMVEILGGYIGNNAYNNVQVWIPLDKIENLIEWSEIKRIDEPLIPQTNSIISEGTGIIGATDANNRGLKGKGIKVGVVDLGFQGYTSLLGTELPASVTTKVMGTDADFTSGVHGTACAEIVHDVAPEAELFLVNAGDIDVDFHNAVSWLQSQGVHVISSSIGINLKIFTSLMYNAILTKNADAYLLQSNYIAQLESQWNNTINDVISNNVTWAQAVGNDAEKKWLGPFNDSDGNYYLNFTTSENYNEIDVSSAQSGDELYVLMLWGFSTGGSTTDDFDLIVRDSDGTEVCSSRLRQAITPIGAEACKFIVEPSKHYAVLVYQYWAIPQDIAILIGHDKFPKFTHYTSASTVNLYPPAYNPNIITVGAVNYNTPNIIESYSSQGPTEDWIIKPDLVAPDCVSTASYGSSAFCGTSAAAPHAAGLSALVKQAYPSWSPGQIKSYLEANALDLGAYGKDNIFGSGLVQLPLSLYETCIYTLSPGANGFDSKSSPGVVTVIPASSSCSWTAASNASWITITSGSSLTGSGTVTYSVAANTTGSSRTGTITVAGSTITVTQTAFNAALYFPHVATSIPWQTEIAIINTSPDQTVTGTLRALSDEGQLIETKAVTLSARGRRQITVANEFTDHTDIGYIIFDTDSDAVQGYTKFYREGYYRAAIPAVKEVNTSDIYISHIASSTDWWTGVSLVNTTSATKVLTITFNNGQSRSYTLNAGEHRAFDIASLFNNQPQPDIQSAVITNASGIIGLELFGNNGGSNHLDGILLTDNTASTIYYPHVASDNIWWTGIVAYNPSGQESYITITPYSAQGILLSTSTLTIAGKEKYIGPVSQLGLPAQTAWFKIDSTRPLSGFELFGTVDGNQLAAYAGSGGTGAKAGVFAKIEKNGWTGIAFVNTEDSAASVTLTAYNDNGSAVATQVLPVGGHAKVVKVAEAIFSQDIRSATYIAYSSDRNVVGFQLNGSSDGMMLDGLPGLGTEPSPGAGMVLIPAGSFQMGGVTGEGYSDEFPAHSVTLSAFYLDKYEVTKSLWDEVYAWATAHGYTFDYVGSGSGANHPIHTISWYDVVKWLNARSEKEGRQPVYYADSGQATVYRTGQVNVAAGAVKWSVNGYRLPTEAEWEYAARGGTTTRFYTGNCISTDQANYYGVYPWTGCAAGHYRGGTTAVGSFAANPWGLYDMAGNVWEWTWDWYGAYSSSAVTNPRGPDSGSVRVFRDGSWGTGAYFLRSAYRGSNTPSYGSNGVLGFRSALSQP